MGKEVELKELKIKEIVVTVKGKTPLLMEKMNMDVVEEYNKKRAGKISAREHKKLEEELVEGKIHYTDNGNVGFPSSGFHKGMVEVAPYLDGIYKKGVRGSVVFVDQMVPINYKKKKLHTAWGKTSGRTKSPRKIIRPMFTDWSADLRIRFNSSNLTAEHIVNLLQWAGFQCGIGGWRPECGGTFGQYEVTG
jgi:hypothetical protein